MNTSAWRRLSRCPRRGDVTIESNPDGRRHAPAACPQKVVDDCIVEVACHPRRHDLRSNTQPTRCTRQRQGRTTHRRRRRQRRLGRLRPGHRRCLRLRQRRRRRRERRRQRRRRRAGAEASSAALEVVGKAKFSRSGRTTIAKGKASIRINLAGTSTSSHVLAVLGSVQTGRWIRAVVPSSGYFTVYLNTTTTANAFIHWFVIN